LHLSVYISGLDRFSIERLLSNFERQEEVKIHSRKKMNVFFRKDEISHFSENFDMDGVLIFTRCITSSEELL
jgi:hypothetical protein